MSIEGTVLVMKNSEQAWAHRALVAAEKIHNEDPSAEYFKAFIDMRSNTKRLPEFKPDSHWEYQKDD
jgi:hypothetical protein